MNNTVCLCGSTRFRADFEEANRQLTRRGLSIITISFALEKDADGNEREPMTKEVLDLVHLNKIMRSDAIFVVGDGYVGHSTKREMIWACMQGKYILEQMWCLDKEGNVLWDLTAARLRGGTGNGDLEDYIKQFNRAG